LGSNMPFISSADGFLLEKIGNVSLFGRAIALGKLLEFLTERKIARLPYSRTLYLLSTGGVEFKS
jgi:hypothetical protein